MKFTMQFACLKVSNKLKQLARNTAGMGHDRELVQVGRASHSTHSLHVFIVGKDIHVSETVDGQQWKILQRGTDNVTW